MFNIDFDDLESDISAAPTRQVAKPTVIYTEICPKCNGTGRYHFHSSYGSVCFACGGAGEHEFKTSPEYRREQRDKAKARKATKLDGNLSRFEAEHPDVAAWWKDTTFEAAISLREAVRKYGDLTPRQLDMAKRCVAKLAAIKAEQAARIENAQAVDIGRIELAFKTAQSNGIKKPNLNLGEFKFKLAPDTGKNAGAIYVTEGDTYLGKIQGGKLFPSRECNNVTENAIITAAAKPDEAAKAYGLRTGVCSVCGRPLTNHASIDIGIGPICAGRFGW